MLQFLDRITLLLIIGLTMCTLGCQNNSTSRYTPASTTARQAVDTALSRWKSGTKYGTNTGTAQIVIVEEPRWKSGMRLENYEILDEVPGTQYPQFKVKLNFVGKPEITTEYLVVGIDPPIVYNKEEFDISSGKGSGM